MAKIKTRKPRHRVLKKAHPIRWRFRRWLMPTKSNNFRPKLIDRYAMAALALVFVAIQMLTPLSGESSVLGQQAPINSADLLQDTNSERHKAGAPPLMASHELSEAAALKAQDMIDNNYWSHTSPSGVTPWYWLGEADYKYAYAGENLARNFNSAGATVAAWMASPDHRRNMLHQYYTEAGFAVVDGMMDNRPTRLVVALYGTPASSLTEVAGIHTQAPGATNLGLLSRIGVAIQSMSAPMLGLMSLVLLALIVAIVTAAVMFGNRNRIQGGAWRRYHATIKAVVIGLFVIIVTLAQSSGQIG